MKKKGLLTAVIGISLVLVLIMALLLAGGCAPGKKMYKIGVTQIVTHPALDAIRGASSRVWLKRGLLKG